MYRVLMISKHKKIVKQLNQYLDWELYGFSSVTAVTTYKEAKSMLSKNIIDLLILDMSIQSIDDKTIDTALQKSIAKPTLLYANMINDGFILHTKNKLSLECFLVQPNNDETDRFMKKLNAWIDNSRYIKQAIIDMPSAVDMHNRVDKIHYQRKIPIDDAFLNEFIDYIQCHYTTDISLKNFSEHFYMNYTYCSELFKKKTGTCFSTFITKLRLNHACRLLTNTEFNIAEIATESGFNDYFYFTKLFKKEMHVTPSEYRSNLKLDHHHPHNQIVVHSIV